MTGADAGLDPAAVRDEYRRALDELERVLVALPPGAWDRPSKCPAWSIADVTGHVVFGLELVRALATGGDRPGPEGAPGAPAPRVVAGADPVGTLRRARDATLDALTDDAVLRAVEVGGPFGERPLGGFVRVTSNIDALAHTWDIGAAAGIEVRLVPDLVVQGHALTKTLNLTRSSRGLAEPLEPPADADAQTRFLAFLGRRAW